MENNISRQSFEFDCIQWTGNNKEEILKFSLIMNTMFSFVNSRIANKE